MIEPAVRGTRNVLDACVKASIKRVVVVSSAGAVMLNPNWPKDKAMDEQCWSDRDFCKTSEVIINLPCILYSSISDYVFFLFLSLSFQILYLLLYLYL